MFMSFYGSSGTIMTGLGIDKLFQNIYGENAVKNMLSGEAVARANIGYILTESALLIKLQQIAYPKVQTIQIVSIWKLFKSFIKLF